MIDKSKVVELSAPCAATKKLCSNLSQGLHAAAQPLTILRASLSKGSTDRMTRDELRGLAARSAIEVERVCALFGCLQQLVHIESIKPQLSATPILPLLMHAADGVSLLYERDGMRLCSMLPDNCEPVLIDSERTLRALSSVLLVAHTISRKLETIELIASSSRAVRVVVRNATSYVDTMNAQASLSMALAEADIRSQGAVFSWSPQPFIVQMEFQKAILCTHD